MSSQKITQDHFDPADADYRGKLWVRVVTENEVFIHVFWRRIALVSLITVAGLWLAGTVSAWAFLKFSRGFSTVSYVDLLLPPRWPEHRAAYARDAFTRGEAAFAQHEYQNAATLLQTALEHAPRATATRLLLAATHLRLGRIDQAFRVLNEGLVHADDPAAYLELAFARLHATQEDEPVLQFAREILPSLPPGTPAHRFVVLQTAVAHLHRGAYDEVERLIETHALAATAEAQALLVRCEVERGYPASARQRLVPALVQFPAHPALQIEQLRLNGPTDADAAAIDALLAAAGADTLVRLAALAVDRADLGLAGRIRALARDRSLPPNAFNLAVVKAAVQAEDFASALTAAQTALAEDEDKFPGFIATVSGLQAVAHLGLGQAERAERLLRSALPRQKIRADDARLIVRPLERLGLPESARTLLGNLVRDDPQNQTVLTELIRLDVQLGRPRDLAVHTARLLKFRRPERAVLTAAAALLTGPEYTGLRAQIDAALARLPG